MEVINYIKKFRLLFEGVLRGNIVLTEHSTGRILKILEDTSDSSPRHCLLDAPCFSDIIFESLQSLQNADITVKVFFLEIITQLLGNELQFSKMKIHEFHKMSVKYCVQGNLCTSLPPPALHAVSIKLATAHIYHCSGIDVLLQDKAWEYVLHPDIYDKPLHIAKAAYNFVTRVVWKLSSIGMESQLLEVLEFVVRPIVSSEYIDVQDIDTDMDIRLRGKIMTFLRALLAILNETEHIMTDNRVIPILKGNFFLEYNLHKILITTRCNDVILTTVDCLMRLSVAMHQNLLFSGKVDEFCNIMVAYHHNHIVRLLCKGSLQQLIDYIVQWTLYWKELESSERMKKANFKLPLTFERNGQKLQLASQLTSHLLVPMLVYRTDAFPETIEDITDTIIMKMSSTLTEHIFSTCYALRQLLLSTKAAKPSAILTIKELSRLKGRLNKNEAGKLFMSLYYVLETFSMSDGAGLIVSEDALKSADDVQLLSHTLSAIKMLLEEHRICWYEIVEIANLQAMLMNLLKHKKLDTLVRNESI